MRRRFPYFALLLALVLAPPAHAVDPPYQSQMERLAEIMGSLYMLAPLCGEIEIDWRDQMAELIALDEPDEDRRGRLAGAFNGGFEAYSRLHRHCTDSARTAMGLLLREGETLSHDIYSRFAE